MVQTDSPKDNSTPAKPAAATENKAPRKDDDADAEKAYAAAAEKVTSTPAAKDEAKPVAATPAVEPAKPAAKAKKAAPKKTASKKKAAPKKSVAKKAVKSVKKTSPKKGSAKMTKTVKKVATNTKAANSKAANRVEDMVSAAGKRAKSATDKTMELAGTATEFQRGNVEAMIESGKIAAKGITEIAKQNAAYARTNLENASQALQGVVSVKTPREMFAKQNEYVRSGFDTLVSQSSKNAEAWVKLAGDMFQPISNRAAVVGEKVKKAA